MNQVVRAQENILTDTLQTDTIAPAITDSLSGSADSTSLEGLEKNDTLQLDPARQQLEDIVERFARDSIIQDLISKKVYLYGEAKVIYQDITLEADYIEVDFVKNEVFAHGLPDTNDVLIGEPVFTQGGQTFKAKEMTYNFDTKKGLIKTVFTEDATGYLHGQRVKKMEDNAVNIKDGAYTTCNLEDHPHFEFRFKKAKVIPNDKIVTGPAYMSIEGVPTPLAVPFGLFPNNPGQRSGIIIPTYGESRDRGFFFENGGYYLAINDYMDFTILGDIYTRGSWALKPSFRYAKRYNYSGDLNATYAINILGEEGTADYSRSRDFRIRWMHRQDRKAHPTQTFSANVNIVSSNYNTFNPTTTQEFLSNEFQSSIAYQRSWANKYFLTLNGSHRQNVKTQELNITLPELTFNVNQFFPLRKKVAVGSRKWYEDLAVSYSTNARNTLDLDTFSITSSDWQNMQNGMIHRIPVDLPLKVMQFFTLRNAVTITDRMYLQSFRKTFITDSTIVDGDTLVNFVQTDTVQGFRNAFDYNLSTNLATIVYGLVQFKKGPIRAIRHVFTPGIGLSYRPDFSEEQWGYYGSYIDASGREQRYAQVDGIFGAPPSGRSGNINYSFTNNLEIKVPSKKDTITGMKKIVLLENLSFSGSYNLAVDSLNFSAVSISARTRLGKFANLTYNSSVSPYAVDTSGNEINTFEFERSGSFFRPESNRWDIALTFRLSGDDFKKKEDKNTPKDAEEGVPLEERESEFASRDEMDQIRNNPDQYIDWTVPWSIQINYKFGYTQTYDYRNFEVTSEPNINQTLNLRGDVNITPKWKVTFATGWDFRANDISYTSVNIYRDLHCWEMRFSWIPFGQISQWNFAIQVKASVLQDLKLTKRRDFRDLQ